MKLCVITPPHFFTEESQILTALFEEGLELLHVRKPEGDFALMERLLTLIPEEFHNRVVLHDHFSLCERFRLGGIHLNRRNPKKPSGYKGSLSCSCHTIEEVRDHRHQYDYVFLSPVFDSISKAGYKATFSPEQLASVAHRRVYALGGVEVGNLRQLQEWGFGGACLMGALWRHFTPYASSDYEGVTTYYRKACRALYK